MTFSIDDIKKYIDIIVEYNDKLKKQDYYYTDSLNDLVGLLEDVNCYSGYIVNDELYPKVFDNRTGELYYKKYDFIKGDK